MFKAGPAIRRAAVAATGLAALAMGPGARAQSAAGTLSQFHGGYNSGLSGLEGAINVSTRDANGNLVITDGVIQVGSDNSVFSHAYAHGAGDAISGASAYGTGSATAIGNNLNVNVSGNYNTVIVNANQTNTGNISATTVLNGKVNLDGGQ